MASINKNSCLICCENEIDKMLTLYSCNHQPLCSKCIQDYFKKHSNTKCPYCRSEVGENIIFSYGIINIKKRSQEYEARCLICSKIGYNISAWKCNCGCQCKVCKDCASEYNSNVFEDFCFCRSQEKSQSPYDPSQNASEIEEHKDQSEYVNVSEKKYIDNSENLVNVGNVPNLLNAENISQISDKKKYNDNLQSVSIIEQSKDQIGRQKSDNEKQQSKESSITFDDESTISELFIEKEQNELEQKKTLKRKKRSYELSPISSSNKRHKK